MTCSRRQFLSTCAISVLLVSRGPTIRFLVPEAAAAAVEQVGKQGPSPKIIEGLSVELTGELVAKDSPTVVWADTIALFGHIKTQGSDLILIARIIRFEDGSLVNTMAASPAPDFPTGSRAKDAPNLGGNGMNGGSGGPGGDAGDVLIIANRIEGPVIITADGQRGGNAQSGGNGRRGKPGEDHLNNHCEDGGTGGPGGRGGMAGKPGNGGDGGHVDLVCSRPTLLVIHSISVDRGNSGTFAQHGKPGPGGRGGEPGPPLWDFRQIVR